MTALSTATAFAPGPTITDRLQDMGCRPLDQAQRPGWLARLRAPFGRPGEKAPAAAVAAPIASLLRSLPTGGWSIPRDTAHALTVLVMEAAPIRILELGSGVSTVLLAALCAESGRPTRVVSLEERPRYAERTQRLLVTFGLDGYASVLTAPVRLTRFGNWRGYSYEPNETLLRRALGGRAVDFLFVDGPASWGRGRGDCRFSALPLVWPWAAARLTFAIDDAWRRRDFDILKRWQQLPGVTVDGIIPVGRGLGIGTLTASAGANGR
jgi:hypothetical protein